MAKLTETLPLGYDGHGNEIPKAYATITVVYPDSIDSDEFRQTAATTMMGEFMTRRDRIIEELRKPVVGQTATLEVNE